MNASLRFAAGWVALAAIATVLAASQADAQRRESQDWIAPPLEAIGRAFGRVLDLGEETVRPAKRQGRKAQSRKAARPKAKPPVAIAEPARLPRTRPAAASVTVALTEADRPAEPMGSEIAALDAQPPSNPETPPPSFRAAPPLPRPRLEPTASQTPRDASPTAPAPAVVMPAPPRAAGDLAATPPAFAPPESVEAIAADDTPARLPRTRPAATELAALEPDAVETPAPPAPVEPSPNLVACLKRLTALGAVYRETEPIDPGGDCPVAAPLEVTALGSGIAIKPGATLNCRAAEALALWARDSLIPAALAHLQAVPTEITQVSTYVCRTRNHQAGAKLSEHASANAIDIGAIGFAHRPPHSVVARPLDDAESRFAAAIRSESCRFFTTVLGPGSDAAHATHLHFDMAERAGGYRLCELGDTETAGPPTPNTKRE